MKSSDAENLSKTLRMLRALHGYPQKFLAARLGISQAAYSKMERGCLSAQNHLDGLAAVYGLPPETLEGKTTDEVVRGTVPQVPHS